MLASPPQCLNSVFLEQLHFPLDGTHMATPIGDSWHSSTLRADACEASYTSRILVVPCIVRATANIQFKIYVRVRLCAEGFIFEYNSVFFGTQ